MNTAHVVKDEDNKQMIVTRPFNAPLKEVWDAWTTSELLDKWWGPKPYDVTTKSFAFKPGGEWLYAMAGPEGDKHWCKAVYGELKEHEYFTATDTFCDEEGKPSTDMPQNKWHVAFEETDGVTTVITTTTFESLEDMHKLLEMGMEQGFSMGLNQLEDLLAR